MATPEVPYLLNRDLYREPSLRVNSPVESQIVETGAGVVQAVSRKQAASRGELYLPYIKLNT